MQENIMEEKQLQELFTTNTTSLVQQALSLNSELYLKLQMKLMEKQ
jgi:hypothetical protein